MELHRNATNWTKVVDDIVKQEKKIFPKHESLARSFDEELRKKNSGLLYMDVDGEVVGYVMYSWPSSLCASVTKLAGSKSIFFLTFFFCQINDFFSFHWGFSSSIAQSENSESLWFFFSFCPYFVIHLSCSDDFNVFLLTIGSCL